MGSGAAALLKIDGVTPYEPLPQACANVLPGTARSGRRGRDLTAVSLRWARSIRALWRLSTGRLWRARPPLGNTLPAPTLGGAPIVERRRLAPAFPTDPIDRESAAELQDAMSQTLFAGHMLAGALARATDGDAPIDAARVRSQALAIERLHRGALAEMRLLMFELRPDTLAATPFGELLQCLIDALQARHAQLVVHWQVAIIDDLPAAVRTGLYRIARGALSNALRQVDVGELTIEWTVTEQAPARLRVSSDGTAPAPDERPAGPTMLDAMQRQARAIGASMTMRHPSAQGIELIVERCA